MFISKSGHVLESCQYIFFSTILSWWLWCAAVAVSKNSGPLRGDKREKPTQTTTAQLITVQLQRHLSDPRTKETTQSRSGKMCPDDAYCEIRPIFCCFLSGENVTVCAAKNSDLTETKTNREFGDLSMNVSSAPMRAQSSFSMQRPVPGSGLTKSGFKMNIPTPLLTLLAVEGARVFWNPVTDNATRTEFWWQFYRRVGGLDRRGRWKFPSKMWFV